MFIVFQENSDPHGVLRFSRCSEFSQSPKSLGLSSPSSLRCTNSVPKHTCPKYSALHVFRSLDHHRVLEFWVILGIQRTDLQLPPSTGLSSIINVYSFPNAEYGRKTQIFRSDGFSGSFKSLVFTEFATLAHLFSMPSTNQRAH